MKSNLYNLRNTAKLFRAMSLIFCTVLIFADQYSGYSSTTVNVYPQTSTRWTGSVVANGTISTSSVMYSQGGGNSRSWMKVDLSGIPVGSIINSVSIKYFVTSMYNPQLQFRKVTTDPVTAPGSTLFSQIGSGYNYITVSANSLGWNTRTPTGGFQTQLRTDIQNSIATGWFALGIYDVDGSSYFEAYIDGWNQLNKPYLVINYTSTLNNDIALDSITSPLNFACEGNMPIKIKMTNASYTTPITSVLITWSINSMVQPNINWSGILGLGASTYVILNPTYLFNPGNYIINVSLANPNNLVDPFMANNSKVVLLQITPKPSVYMQPTNQSIGVGGDALFSTVGAGGNITYQWQVSTNGGTSFTNITNLSPYSNVTSQNMNITAAPQSMNGYLYRCVICGTCAPCAITDTVMLSVGPPVNVKAGHSYACAGATTTIPIIVKNAIGALGTKLTLNFTNGNIAFQSNTYTNPLISGNGSFTVTPATGKVTIDWIGATPVNLPNDTICKLSFQYFNNSNLIFDSVTVGNCKVTGAGGAVFPTHYINGALTTAAPTIVTQPDNKLIITGQTGFFRVIVAGTPTYQWQVSTNGGTTWTNLSNLPPYFGVNDDTLWVTPTLSMNGYRYRCVLNSCSSVVNSTGALMNVMKLVKTWVDTIYSCTCWTPYKDILVPIKVSNFDSINSISLSLLFKNTALQYNGYQNVNPALQFPIINATPIGSPNMIRIASFATTGYMAIPDNGILVNLKFKVLCDTTKLQWETWTPGACQYSTGPDTAIYVFDAEFRNGFVLDGGPSISTNPVNQTLYAGGVATFTCNGSTHGGSLSYQWQVSTNGGTTYTDCTNGAVYTGVTTGTLTVNASSTSMNGYKYRCRLNGLCDEQITTAALLTVNAPPIYVTIPPIISCQGDTIFVPINVQNFASVCSVSLKLQFNNALMSYVGYSDVNPSLSGGSMTVGVLTNTVGIAWFSVSPSTISGTGTMIKLKFVTTNLFINSPLTWSLVPNDCQITNCSAVNISSNFANSTVSVNPIPVVHNVITPFPAAGHYCAGDLGVTVGLDITQPGVNYALYRNGVLVSGYTSVPGTGFGITFNTFSVAGVYTVRAVYPVTGCSVAMDGFVNITIDAPPTLYNVTGTGSYCTGGAGLPVGLSNSQLGVDYFLLLNGVIIDTLAGTGLPLDFGNQTAAGTYTIVGRNAIYETCQTTMSNSAVITINPYPAAAGTINGPTSVCQGGTATISVGAISNATSYTWTVPAGFTITSSSTGSTITVSVNTSAVTGSITVKGTNLCGDGTPSSYTITVNPLPSAAGIITGTNPVCQGATAVVYSVPTILNAATYAWTFPGGFTLVTNNGSSATVNVGNLAASGNITVTGVNACGNGVVGTLAVTVSPLPGNAVSINGSSTPCQGATITYSTPPVSAATSYIWTIPSNATGSSSTNSIVVTYPTNAVSGNITVTPHNSCGNGNTYTLPINVQPLPGAAGTIGNGPADVCKGSTYTYTVPLITGASTYVWTLPSGFTGTSTTNSITVTIGVTAVSGNITVAGHNTCGDGVLSVKAVTVHALPTPVLPAFPTICKDAGNYTLSGGSPVGGTYTGTGVTAGQLNPAITGAGTFTITYTYTDPFGCTGSITQSITVVDYPKISGTLNYDNIALTPLGNVKVYLKTSANVMLDSVLTSAVNPFGNYSFKCLTAATNYNLDCKIPTPTPATRVWPIGPVNGTDALLIMKHAVGLITLTPFQAKAADVNANGSVNSVDALLVMKRFVGTISYFTAGDWCFNPSLFNSVIVGSTAVTQNIRALVYGDVNASYTPSNIKISPSVFLESKGNINLNESETIDLPITATAPFTTGAISLALDFPADNIEILGLSTHLDGLLYNVLDGQVRIVWSNLQAQSFQKGESLFILKVRMKDGINHNDQLSFDLDAYSEISDADARAFEKVTLNIPKLTYSNVAGDPSNPSKEFYLGPNQPNPFSNISEISYTLPENGKVHLSIMNLLGEEVKVIVNEQQTAGNYKVRLEGNGLTPGMYLYKLDLKGEGQHYLQSRTMIVMD